MAMVCCRVCKSTPIIFISASFVPSNLWLEHQQFTRLVVRPTSLCHQTDVYSTSNPRASRSPCEELSGLTRGPFEIGSPTSTRNPMADWQMREKRPLRGPRPEPAGPTLKNYITPAGLQRLKDEHGFLLRRERPAVG